MILNLCSNDYANFMDDMTKAMKTAGLKVTAAKRNPHEFGYKDEVGIPSHAALLDLIRKAEIIQIFHSDLRLYNLAIATNPKAKRIMYHTGSLYRQNPDKYNQAIDPQTKIVHALGEFMTLGAPKPLYIVGAINTNKILPSSFDRVSVRTPRTFGHFPSSKINKGTALIERLMESHLDINYITSGTLLPHPDHMDRIREVDILIELFSPTQAGKKYGSWGITCLEAAAMGKAIITQNLSDQVYREHYGDHPLILVQNPQEFHEAINALRDMSHSDLFELKMKTWKWVVENHSYAATGRYIKDNIL
tara:strand:- start:3714 stop:4628 length:915 start_codon:yes stop_codon:yes gene_type:complete